MNEGKMTLEEFQQILEDVEMSTDFASILNKIALYCYRISDGCVANGYESLAKYYLEKGSAIFNSLNQRGYYNED